MVAKRVNEWMDRHPFHRSSLGFRYYYLRIYIRPNERGWLTPVYLWDIPEEEIGGQVCLGPESALIFKPESDADNSCSFSAFWTRLIMRFHGVHEAPGWAMHGDHQQTLISSPWYLPHSWGSWSSFMNPVTEVLVADAEPYPEVVNFPASLFSWWERAGRENGHLPPTSVLPFSWNKTVKFRNH